MKQKIDLVPYPRIVSFASGENHLGEDGLIMLDPAAAQDLVFSGSRIQQALSKGLNCHWEITASSKVMDSKNTVILRLAPERAPQVQGYRLHILGNQILVDGHDLAGVFYGVCTLIQVIRQFGREIPCLEIQDWPDFGARGVMLDISRDKVYRMETLFELVDRLASLKMNQLQLYTEHTFAYRQHPEVWKDASPLTGGEILVLDAYCRDRFMELVPNQNSFGHMERWLKLDRYAPLAEIHGEFTVPWGTVQGPFSISPAEPGSFEFIRGLYDELLPHFTSQMINIGCDETFDLGSGKSKAICVEKGTGRVYLDFLLQLYKDLAGRGRTVQFWGDIILLHPELVEDLPRDLIALEWGYEGNHPFAEHGRAFADSGIPYYVCPGTSSWNSIVGRTDNAVANLMNAAENGVKFGSIGYLITDWGDGGHWQPPAVSLLGFVTGAAYSWAVEANRSLDIMKAVSLFGFDDPSGEMGKLAFELGNVYKMAGIEPGNYSALEAILRSNLSELANRPELQAKNLQAVLSAIDMALTHLEKEQMARPDADLIKKEYKLAARLVSHACKRGLFGLGIQQAPTKDQLRQDMTDFLGLYQEFWLMRNRPGGLSDSICRFEELIHEYSS